MHNFSYLSYIVNIYRTIILTLAAVTAASLPFQASAMEPLKKTFATAAISNAQEASTRLPVGKSPRAAVKSALVTPYRAADIPAEISGVITRIYFEVGDRVQKGEIVCEVSPERYSIRVGMVREKLEGLKAAQKMALKNLKLRRKVFTEHFGTRQTLLQAESEASMTAHRVEEAKRELQLALLNLKACKVKAPYSGYLTAKYKEQFEAVSNLDKLFRVVDTRKVYVVANVPQDVLSLYKRHSPACFVDSAGRRFKGTIDKVEPTICPESKTAKAHVLFDNPEGRLKAGMTGWLAPE